MSKYLNKMDINDLTIDDIREQRPDLYQEIVKKAKHTPCLVTDDDVEEIIKRSSEMGIKRIKFSVCDMYKGSTVRMPDGRTRVKPAAWVPELERTEQQQGKEARDALWNALV